MNCPECGRFMKLRIAFECGHDDDVWTSAFWWACVNDWGCVASDRNECISAPEYQWLWNCQGIPPEAFDDWPELRAECRMMWERLPKSYKTHYHKEAVQNGLLCSERNAGSDPLQNGKVVV